MGNSNRVRVTFRWPAMLVAAVSGVLVSPGAAAHLLAVSVSTSAQQVQVTNLGKLGPLDVALIVVHDRFCPAEEESVSVAEHTVSQVEPNETRVITFAQLGFPSLCADGKLVVTARGRALQHQDIVLAHAANAAALQGFSLIDCTSPANMAKIETDLVFTNWFDANFIPGGCSQGFGCLGLEEYQLRVDNRSAVDSYGVGLKAKYQCRRSNGAVCNPSAPGCIGGPDQFPGEDEAIGVGVVPPGQSRRFTYGTVALPRCCDTSAFGQQCAFFQVTGIGSGVCAPAFISPRTYVQDPGGPADPELGCAFAVLQSSGGTSALGPIADGDVDADGADDGAAQLACDCHLDCSGPLGCENPASDVFAVPLEAAGAHFRVDATTLEWDGQRYNTGAANVFDVVRGNLPTDLGPLPGGEQSCLELGSADTTSVDSASPSPETTGFSGFYYWVRGRNPCGTGSYGKGSSSGSERNTTACAP